MSPCFPPWTSPRGVPSSSRHPSETNDGIPQRVHLAQAHAALRAAPPAGCTLLGSTALAAAPIRDHLHPADAGKPPLKELKQRRLLRIHHQQQLHSRERA